MKRYFGGGAAPTGSDLAMINLESAATIRPAIYDVVVGCEATPADLAADFKLQRTTAVGTEASGFTPVALDPADPPSLADIGVDFNGGQPTKTANAFLLQFSMNQRNTFRWVCGSGKEIIAPATASNGICMNSSSVSSGTTTYETTFHWFE